MDWNAAIEKNREALKRILAALVAMAGLADGGAGTLSRHLHRAVLRLLRPAEAATRRLVIVAARGLVVTLPPSRPRKPKRTPTILRNGVGTGILMPPGVLLPPPLKGEGGAHVSESPSPLWGGVRGGGKSATARPLTLPLLDPLPRWKSRPRRAAKSVPRISVPGITERFPLPPPPSPNDPVDATRLGRRFAALAAALDDLPAHARRFARWRAARDAIVAQNRNRDAGAQTAEPRHLPYRRVRSRRIWPLKPGRPPGWRHKPEHEVHEVLNNTHGLAFDVLERRDTS
jgi:hypothetical protein